MNLDKACCKALDEAISIIAFCLSRQYITDKMDTREYGWVRTLEDHAVLYAHWKESLAFAFLERVQSISLDDAQKDWSKSEPLDMDGLRSIACELSLQGLDVLWCEITAPEIVPYGHVVRVVVPQAVPLSQMFGARWLASPRRQKVCAASGANYEPNAFPHPFA
jgi:hypothetical protein